MYKGVLKSLQTKTAPSPFNSKVRQVAEEYAKSKGIDLTHPTEKIKVNPERAKKIAQAYEQMPHDPNHPDVKRAYDALTQETLQQFGHILKSGLKVSRMGEGQENPYKNSKDLFKDITENNHMWFFPTESGYGSTDEKVANHPLLAETEHKANGHPLLANDVFRIVHDYFGHAKEGYSFGPRGEENAWRLHKQMYSPHAQKALTSETRGQNSWVNFGPHGEQNRANPAQTKYADQKAGLLPDWAHEHEEPMNKAEDDSTLDFEKAPNSTRVKTPRKASKQRSFGEKVSDTLEDVKEGRNTPSQYAGVFAAGEKPRKSTFGAQKNTVYSYGPHWPILQILDGNTVAVNTNTYGGTTEQLVNKVLQDIPNKFPDYKVVKVHHPDYKIAAKTLQGGKKAVISHLQEAAEKHPDEEYRQSAVEDLEHLLGTNKVKKSSSGKREAIMGWDEGKNEQIRIDRLNRYLESIGLQVQSPDPEEKGRNEWANRVQTF